MLEKGFARDISVSVYNQHYQLDVYGGIIKINPREYIYLENARFNSIQWQDVDEDDFDASNVLKMNKPLKPTLKGDGYSCAAGAYVNELV